jgi:hypothetical protein
MIYYYIAEITDAWEYRSFAGLAQKSMTLLALVWIVCRTYASLLQLGGYYRL